MRPEVGGRRGHAESLVDRLHQQLLGTGGPPVDTSAATIHELARIDDPLLPEPEVTSVVEQLQARMSGLGVLEPLLADASVSEVMVNGGGAVWIERDGRLERTELAIDEPTVLQLIERIVGPLGLSIDRVSPIVDARLPDGSRVNAVVRPLAVDGPCLTIRRFGARRIELDAVATPGTAALLRWAVRARLNILVCGGAGAGKTTLLNALAAEIDDHERVITVEDAAEQSVPLQVGHRPVTGVRGGPGDGAPAQVTAGPVPAAGGRVAGARARVVSRGCPGPAALPRRPRAA